MSRNKSEQVFKYVVICIVAAFFLFFVVALVQKAEAKEVTSGVQWEQPLFNEDGTALEPEELSSFEIHYTVDKPFTEMKEPVLVEYNKRTFSLELSLKPRREPYTVNMAVRAVTIYGTKSEMSDVITNTFNLNSTQRPVKPINISITISCDETCAVVNTNVE